MKTKHSIIATMTLGMPMFMTGCHNTADFIVDAKDRSGIVMHLVAAPRDTSVMVLRGNYVKYEDYINLGDTVQMSTSYRDTYFHNNTLWLPNKKVGINSINGKTLENISEMKAQKATDSARHDLIREIISRNQKVK